MIFKIPSNLKHSVFLSFSGKTKGNSQLQEQLHHLFRAEPHCCGGINHMFCPYLGSTESSQNFLLAQLLHGIARSFFSLELSVLPLMFIITHHFSLPYESDSRTDEETL